MNPIIVFGPREDSFLLEHYAKEGVDWVASKLNTTSKCVRRRAVTLRKMFDRGELDINIDQLYSKEGSKSAHPCIKGPQPQPPGY